MRLWRRCSSVRVKCVDKLDIHAATVRTSMLPPHFAWFNPLRCILLHACLDTPSSRLPNRYVCACTLLGTVAKGMCVRACAWALSSYSCNFFPHPLADFAEDIFACAKHEEKKRQQHIASTSGRGNVTLPFCPSLFWLSLPFFVFFNEGVSVPRCILPRKIL